MLVLTGEKASGEFLIQQARLVDNNVEGVVIKGSGHWLMEEAPNQVIPKLVSLPQSMSRDSWDPPGWTGIKNGCELLKQVHAEPEPSRVSSIRGDFPMRMDGGKSCLPGLLLAR
jgi:hypothetical protein